MPVALILGLESIHSRPQDGWWVIQEPCLSEALILYCFAKVVLEHTAFPIARSANYNITQTDIMLFSWGTTADADHQTNPDIGKAVQHVSRNTCCRVCAVLSIRQDSDD